MNTEIKTQLEILVSLRDEQQEAVLNRQVSISMLRKMAEKDPNRVLTMKVDMQQMQAKPVTVKSRLSEMEDAFELDTLRLEEIDEMIKNIKVG